MATGQASTRYCCGMRWLVPLLMVAVAGVGSTGPIRPKRLAEHPSLGATAAEREKAVRELAAMVRAGHDQASNDAMRLVIADDPKIRGPLIEALIDAELISRATAAQVPTATVLTKQLAKLLAKTKPVVVPLAKDCRVTGGTAQFATLACDASRCSGSCQHHRTRLTVTTGKRWAISDVQQGSNEDGACGHCMLLE